MRKILFILLCMGLLSPAIMAQNVTLNFKATPLKDVLKEIQNQIDYKFIYNDDQIKASTLVSVNIVSQPLTTALDELLLKNNIAYTINDKQIVLQYKPSVAPDNKAEVEEKTTLTVRGTVLDETGNPLPGVVVVVKGGKKNTTTNSNGQFELAGINPDAVLTVTFLGYEVLEYAISGRSNVTIKLTSTTVKLDEVVVIGYGSTTRESLTGSVSSVKDLEQGKNIGSNVIQSLQGKMAGVQVVTLSGSPTEEPKVYIRGSLGVRENDATRPLYVIDGIVGASYNSINPQDIESIDVLKDAASSAIYGASGSVGVIIITTKKGRLNMPTIFNFDTYYGINQALINRVEVLNNSEYLSFFNTVRDNSIAYLQNELASATDPNRISVLQSAISDRQLEKTRMAASYGTSNINWLDKAKNTAPVITSQQFSMSGGSDKSTFFLSLGHYYEEPTYGNSGLRRISAKVDVTNKARKWLELGGNLMASLSKSDASYSPLSAAMDVRPDTPEDIFLDDKGNYDYYAGVQQHPLGALNGLSGKYKNTNILGVMFAELKLLQNLSFRTSINGNFLSTQRNNYSPSYTYSGHATNGSGSVSSGTSTSYNIDSYFSYKLQASLFKSDLTMGYTYRQSDSEGFRYEAINFASPDIDLLSTAFDYKPLGQYTPDHTRTKNIDQGFFFRANNNWDGKYFLNVSIRADGTSRLAKENRYGWLPAISGAWIASRESFFESVEKIIGMSNLKLRASWGITGNLQNIPEWATSSFFNIVKGSSGMGYSLPTLKPNPDLQWEQIKSYDIGIDIGFFNNRLFASFDYYRKSVNGMIQLMSISSLSGYSQQYVNGVDQESKGFDFDISYTSDPQKAITWNVGFNLSHAKDKVLKANGTLSYRDFVSGSPSTVFQEGSEPGMLVLLEWLGVDPDTGNMMYTDKDGNGKIEYSRSASMLSDGKLYSYRPDVTGGLNGAIAYSGFELSCSAVYSIGNKQYLLNEQESWKFDATNYNGRVANREDYIAMPNKVKRFVENPWTTIGQQTNTPRFTVLTSDAIDYSSTPSTRHLYDASYLRLQNVQLSYTFPKQWLQSISIDALKLYFSMRNVCTLSRSDFNGIDPEVGKYYGIATNSVIPLPRSFVFGLNVTF